MPAIAVLAASLLTAGAAQAQDIYIGTVRFDEGAVWLDRCDLAGNRYILRDAAPDKPVARLKARLATLKGPVYAEVIGQYEEDGDANVLRVLGVEGVQGGKSCHLLDALDALDKPAPPSETPPR